MLVQECLEVTFSNGCKRCKFASCIFEFTFLTNLPLRFKFEADDLVEAHLHNIPCS